MKCSCPELPSVKDFGAIGDGVVDDTASLQDAVNQGPVFLSPGHYRTTSTINVPDGSGLIGMYEASVIVGDNIVGPIIKTYDPNKEITTECVFQTFKLLGQGDIGIYIHSSTRVHMEGIQISSGGQHGLVVEDSWGSLFSNVATNGQIISGNCFHFTGHFNANHCSQIYTSNYNADVNVLVDGGHGSTFSMVTLQGGRYGLRVVGGAQHTFHGIYSENVVTPIEIGLVDTSGHLVNGISIVGGSIGGPYTHHPHYDERGAHVHINYARGVTINGVGLDAYWDPTGAMRVPILDGIYYGACSNVTVDGIYTPSLPTGHHYEVIKRFVDNSAGAEVRMVTSGEENRTQLFMKAPGYTGEYFVMQLDSSGEWVPIPHTPEYAVSPPVGLESLQQYQDLTDYQADDFIYVGGPAAGNSVYRCVSSGTSATNTAPTGQTNGQQDGSVVWDFHGALL